MLVLTLTMNTPHNVATNTSILSVDIVECKVPSAAFKKLEIVLSDTLGRNCHSPTQPQLKLGVTK